MNKVTMILLASFCVLSTYPMQKGKTSKESQSSTAKSSRIENIYIVACDDCPFSMQYESFFYMNECPRCNSKNLKFIHLQKSDGKQIFKKVEEVNY